MASAAYRGRFTEVGEQSSRPVLRIVARKPSRHLDRRDGTPLSDDERRWFREIIQRLAALLALGPSLDALYQEAAAEAFTVEELGIVR